MKNLIAVKVEWRDMETGETCKSGTCIKEGLNISGDVVDESDSSAYRPSEGSDINGNRVKEEPDISGNCMEEFWS